MRSYFKWPIKSKVARDRTRFNLDLPVMQQREKGTRLLVVTNRVPQEDIDGGTLFESSLGGETVRNILLYADDLAGGQLGECAFLNFHEFRVHDMDTGQRQAAEADFTLRVERFIKKFKPDVIVSMGADVTACLLNVDQPEKIADYFGRVKRYPANKKIKFVYTLGVWDFCPDVAFDKRKEEGKKLQSLASLSGIVVRHFEYAIRKTNLFTLDKTDFDIEVVDTYKKFKRMMDVIEISPVVAIDTETNNLSRVANELLTIQFAVNDKKAWILPFHHPAAKWSPKELRLIKKRLKYYFEHGSDAKPSKRWRKQGITRPCHLFQNAKFDLTQMKAQLGLRHYNFDLYDVSGGEYVLEENLKFLSDKQMKHLQVKAYQLDFICKRYGYDPYKAAGVDKNSRTGFKEMSLEKFEKYAAIDVIILFRIMACQIVRAKHEGFEAPKFFKAVTLVLSAMNHIFSEMEFNGHELDKDYLVSVLRPGGKLSKTITELNDKFRTSKAARRVNKKILKQRGAPAQTLFGGKPWEFAINKPEHQQRLFIEEMGLEPLGYGKSGAAQVGKAFIGRYGDKEGSPTSYYKEVGWFGELKKSKTIKSNFLVPFFERVVSEPDLLYDRRLRASYNYLQIITGRSGSFSPNFQNMPSRGALSKLVKRCFIPGPGNLYIKVDYGAHEVRNWANVSGDDVMGGRFIEALRLKRKFIIEDRHSKRFEKIVEELKTKGDIHVQNVYFFFGEWVDKKHPLRQKIKVVIFGVIYGKGPFSLAIDLDSSEDEAKELIAKLFATFKQGGDWLKNTIALAQKNYVIELPFYLHRHLWGYLVPDKQVHGAMDRRGPNTIIQGVSSQMGYVAGRCYQQMKWDYFYSKDLPLVARQNNAVHDSLENESSIAHTAINLYMTEHSMTTQIAKICQKEFDWKLAVDLDVEFEIGGSLAAMTTWSQRFDELPKLVEDTVKYLKDELGRDTPQLEIKKFMHNLDMISALRHGEIAADLKAKQSPSIRMDMDHEFVKGLRL